MKLRTPKIANILTLKGKIMSLKTELENLERIEVSFTPPKTCKNAQKQNETKRIMTPKASVRKMSSDSSIKTFKRSKSRSNAVTEHSPLKQRRNQQQARQTKKPNLRLHLAGLSPKNSSTTPNQKTLRIRSPSYSQSPTSNSSPLNRKLTRKTVKREDEQIDTPRFQNGQPIKADQKKAVNPLFLQAEESHNHKKLFKEKNKSSVNPYLSHGGSNTYMYMSPKNHQMFLSTTKTPSKKNVSQTIVDTLMAYATTKGSPKKEGKKHYAKHFRETVRDVIYRS